MKRWLLWWCLLCPPLLPVRVAQPTNPLVLTGKLSDTPIDVRSHSAFYEDDSGGTLSVAAILTKPFQPLAQWQATHKQRQLRKPQWVRFMVQNSSATDSVKGWLHLGRHGLIRLTP